MRTSNIIYGMVGAAAVGAVLGILFAPHKGSKTREKIAQKSKDYTNTVKDKFDTVVNSVSAKRNRMAEDGNSRFNTVVNEIKGEA